MHRTGVQTNLRGHDRRWQHQLGRAMGREGVAALAVSAPPTKEHKQHQRITAPQGAVFVSGAATGTAIGVDMTPRAPLRAGRQETEHPSTPQAGGPGSSSAPGSRSKAEQPRPGKAWTLAACGSVQSAAEPCAVMPSKRLQCQQGWSGTVGAKCVYSMPPACRAGGSRGEPAMAVAARDGASVPARQERRKKTYPEKQPGARLRYRGRR